MRTGLFTLALFVSVSAQAVNPDLLWLPKSYKYLTNRLQDAAIMMEESPRCQKVLGGKLHEGKSSAEKPHFTISCRDDKGVKYNEIYFLDTATNEVALLESSRKVPKEKMPGYIDESISWGICLQAVEDKANKLLEFKLIEDAPMPVEVGDKGQHLWFVDFDAVNQSGKQLYFRAECTVLVDRSNTVKLRARPRS